MKHKRHWLFPILIGLLVGCQCQPTPPETVEITIEVTRETRVPQPTAEATPEDIIGDKAAIDGNVCSSAYEVGRRIAYYTAPEATAAWYGSACSNYGVLMFSEITDDASLLSISETAYAPYLTGRRQPQSGGRYPVDNNIFGIWPFELYRLTGNDEYLPLAQHLADEEFDPPRDDGLAKYTRFWVDDMYMVGSLQAQAYKATGDTKYADRCGLQLTAYIEELQQPNGLFHHTLDAPFFWARGNGWGAAAMTEYLLAVPQDHSDYNTVMGAYKKMMAALVEHQDESGMWHQLLDYPDSYLESSSTGMYLYALSTGVRKGWLPADEYLSAIERGWLALSTYVDSEGRVTEICVGTEQSADVQHYLERPRSIGDLHGQAPALWAATGILRLCNFSDE